MGAEAATCIASILKGDAALLRELAKDLHVTDVGQRIYADVMGAARFLESAATKALPPVQATRGTEAS